MSRRRYRLTVAPSLSEVAVFESLGAASINTMKNVRTRIEVCRATYLACISIVFPAFGICQCLCFKTVQLVRLNGDATRVRREKCWSTSREVNKNSQQSKFFQFISPSYSKQCLTFSTLAAFPDLGKHFVSPQNTNKGNIEALFGNSGVLF